MRNRNNMETIRATYIEDDDTYLLHIPLKSGGQTLKIDGSYVSIPRGYNKQHVVQAQDPYNIRALTRNNCIVQYKHADGTVYTPFEYREKVRGWKTADEDGDETYIDLDAEYACRKFTTDCNAVWAENHRLSARLPIIVEKTRRESEHVYMRPLWVDQPNDSARAHYYQYALGEHELAYVERFCEKHGLKLEVADHTHMYFDKIDHDFVFTKSHSDRVKVPPTFVGTLQECLDKKAQTTQRIDDAIFSKLHLKEKVLGVSDLSVGTLLDRLKTAKKRTGTLDGVITWLEKVSKESFEGRLK